MPTQEIVVVSRFLSSSIFSITPDIETLSSLAVACGPTTLHDLKLQGTQIYDDVVEWPQYFSNTDTQKALLLSNRVSDLGSKIPDLTMIG